MPDPTLKTVSATEISALFDANPYITRWMLWQRFRGGVQIDKGTNSRMDWGKRMQPLVLEHVAAEKKLEVIPNADGAGSYLRRGPLGCTHDATIICPDRGPGALEIKCVFDFRTWGQRWNGGAHVPREIEMQLQQQMLVGFGEKIGKSGFDWGMIAVWVCSEMYYFERKPIPELWNKMCLAAWQFLDDVKDNREPDAFGAAREIPLLTALYETKKDEVLDLSGDEHVKTAEAVRQYQFHKLEEDGNSAAADELRARLLAIAKDASLVLLPCGVNYRVRKCGKGKMIVVHIPEGT